MKAPSEPDSSNTMGHENHEDFMHFVPTRNQKNRKYIGLGIVVFLIVAVLVFGGIKVFGSRKSSSKPIPSNGQTQQSHTNTQITEKDVPDTTKTSTYDNGFLGVKVTYPDTWSVTESDSKDSAKFESPSFSYKTIDKRSVTGNFRIYVRKGARTIDGKYIGRCIAIKPSEKLVYKQPALGQRTETNLTLFGLDSPDNFALFLIAGNYSLNKGDTLGPNYGKEPETYIIAGGFSAKELKDDLATNPVSADLLASSNAYVQALDILKSLQLR